MTTKTKRLLVIGLIFALVIVILIACVACNVTNYSQYAGSYFSSQAEEGWYNNCPRKFVFFDDGSGIYYWKSSTVTFDYKISNGGFVEITDAIGIFHYTGKFSDSKFVLDGSYSSGHSLEYVK